MPHFDYVATSESGGKTTKGTVEASDTASVIEILKKQNLRPLSISSGKKKMASGGIFGPGKVKSDDLVIFTRQLSAMVSAGVPLIRSISSLEQHSESSALRAILVAIIKDIEGGSTLGDSLAKHPKTFSDVYVNMVRAGEAAGILDEILKRLALQQEKSASIHKKVKGAMAYPTVLLVITTIAFFGLMMFVIPQIGKIIVGIAGPGATLPPLTLFMLGTSTFLLHYGLFVIIGVIAAVFFLSRYIKTPDGRMVFHKIVLRTPAVNTVIRKVVVARFARTFAALTGAGVSIIEAMTVTAHALGNAVFEDALLKSVDKVKNGQSLSSIMEEGGLYPAIVSQMLAVGEETGQTDVVLVKIAEFYEEEVDSAINSLSSIIEPVMIVLMGTVVGLIAVSVMGPIAGLANQIK